MKNAEADPLWAVCLKIIRATDRGVHVQAALDAALKTSVDIRKNLCADWIYAYYRFECRADFILGKFLSRPEKLPRDMLIILKLALAAIFTQSGRPDYAIVSGAAEWIKWSFGRSLAGVANGVLRNILKQKDKLDSVEQRGEREEDSVAAHARFYGIPLEMARLWQKAYGEAAAMSLLRRSAARPWQGVRFNPWHESGIKLRDLFFGLKNDRIERIGAWGMAIAPDYDGPAPMGKTLRQWQEAGALSFQAAGSQLVLEKLGIGEWEGPLWDACAGVGGKSMALFGKKCGIALATDSSMKRLRRFACNFPEEIGQKPVFALMDAANPALLSWHGNILADVPCSGLGVLARRPELRKAAADLPNRIQGFQKTQMDILRTLSGLLQPGKKLAYITCTLDPAENEENINRILAERADLCLEKLWQTPHDHPWLEGMFGAALLKKPDA